MFKSEKEIHDFIKNQGLFVNDGDLCIKTSPQSFERLQNICIGDSVIKATDRLDEFFRFNSYPFIDLNNITIPEVDISIINQYHQRNAKIEDNRKAQEQIKDAKDIYKKHFRLIHFDKVSRKEQHYWIFNTKTNALSVYDNELLTDSEKKKALNYPNKILFQRLVNDDLKNEYAEQYKSENKKFDDLKINQDYGSRD